MSEPNASDRLRALIEAEREAVEPPAGAAEAGWTAIARDVLAGVEVPGVDVPAPRARVRPKLRILVAAAGAVSVVALLWGLRPAPRPEAPPVGPDTPVRVRVPAPALAPPAESASAAVASATEPEVQFASAASVVGEADGESAVELTLSRPLRAPVTVQVAVAGGTAMAQDRCSGEDVALSATSITFAPGDTRALVPLRLRDDDRPEADESLDLTITRVDRARTGRIAAHTLTITDDDRGEMSDVTTFGARGDGASDDTRAIQAAIDAAHGRGKGVVLFPPGRYLVRSVTLRDGVSYVGPGATITRSAHAGNGVRSFVARHSGAQPSAPLVIQGLSFDGNRQEQGPYRGRQVEQSHLMLLTGDRSKPGRLQASLENVSFVDGVADGLLVNTNVDARLCHVRLRDLWRGGVRLYGGASSLRVDDLTTEGSTDPSGLELAPDEPGYGGTLAVEVTLEHVRLPRGGFHVGVSDGSRVVGSDVVAGAPFFVGARGATVSIARSVFEVGLPSSSGAQNRIMWPGDVTFEDTRFVLTESLPGQETPEADRVLAIAEVFWRTPWERAPARAPQSLAFRRCRFELADDVEAADTTYVARTHGDDPTGGSRLVLAGSTVAPGFDATFAPTCLGCRVEP
jgi:hypothetical protein